MVRDVVERFPLSGFGPLAVRDVQERNAVILAGRNRGRHARIHPAGN
jgi:hypothetical protein